MRISTSARHRCLASALLALSLCLVQVPASAQVLGRAGQFAVLAGSTVTNTGNSVLTGSLGVWPGSAATGFPPGVIVNGSEHLGDGVAQQAQQGLTTGYNTIAGEALTQDLSGSDLGSLTLMAGVYHFSSSADLTGQLTLDAQGNPNARFDFQIGSSLITATDSKVNIINGGDGCNVYWQVGSSATLGTGTQFAGNILALASITLNTNASIVDGSALARTGAVTLDTNAITSCQAAPEPASMLPVLGALGFLVARRRPRG